MTAGFDTAMVGIRRRIRGAAYLRKWVVLGALIGVISGLGAAIFFKALDLMTRLFLGTLAGWHPATPAAEGAYPIVDPARAWALPIAVGLGGLIAGIIVYRWAPEAEGHGTDAAISAFHHGARRIRARIPVIKLVASAITIGSGGSGGREGPTAQIGAGFGSFLARFLDLDARDARIAVACGIGAGIGAIFRAPLGGAVLAAEIPYRDDVESDALVPAFIASIVAFTIFGAFIGFEPIFGEITGAQFTDPVQLVYYAVIGILAGIVGRLYIGNFYGLTRWFRGWTIPRELRPAIAGVAVGLMGIWIPGALGTGYGWVQAALDRQTLLHLALWMVLLLPFAKILATSLSIGSGGSGGIFGPGVVIGAMLGASVWRLLVEFAPNAPGVPVDPAPFVIVAMMATFGSVAHAPIAVMLMVAEMTGSLGMLGPAMLAIGIATVIVGERTMYESQLRSRTESPGHRFRFAMPLMSSIPAGDAARQPRVVLDIGVSAGAAIERLDAAEVPGAPVIERDGSLRGIVDRDALVKAPPETPVGQLAERHTLTVSADDGLDDVLGGLADHRTTWLPVVAEGNLVGILSARDVMAAYRQALAGNVRQVRGLGTGGVLLEADLGPASPLVGRSVAEAPWPRDVVLVAVERGGALIVPRGQLTLAAGDRVSLFAAPASEEAARGLLAIPTALDGAPEGATPG